MAHERQYWTPTDLINWSRARDVPAAWRPDKRRREVEARIDSILFKLRMLCGFGDIRAEWRATRVPCGESYGYKASDAFEAIPPHFWQNIIFLQPAPKYERTDKVQFYNLLPDAMENGVEVRFRRSDVQRELGMFAAKPKPSRLKPFWGAAREEAITWLKDNGYPQPGDGGQGKLEKHIAGWLASHGDHHPAESTIRDHVRCWIREFSQKIL
jgi:hypothetical protein